MIAYIFFMMFIIGSVGLVLGMSQHIIDGAVQNPCPSNLGILSDAQTEERNFPGGGIVAQIAALALLLLLLLLFYGPEAAVRVMMR